MKKQLLSLLAVSALLMQSSGLYAMQGMWSGANAAAQKYVGTPMGRVASAMDEEQRVQNVLNFLVQLGNDVKKVRSPQELYVLLKSYPKTSAAVGAIIAVILIYLFRGPLQRGVEQLRGSLSAVNAAIKYNIPLQREVIIATGEAEFSKSSEYQFLENLENIKSAYRMYQEYKSQGFSPFLMNNENLLQAADEVARGKHLQQLILAFIRAKLGGNNTSEIEEKIEELMVASTFPLSARAQIHEAISSFMQKGLSKVGVYS